MRNKDDPRKLDQARRIHDHYRAVGEDMMLEFRDTPKFIQRLSEVQKRKARAGQVLGIGMYQSSNY